MKVQISNIGRFQKRPHPPPPLLTSDSLIPETNNSDVIKYEQDIEMDNDIFLIYYLNKIYLVHIFYHIRAILFVSGITELEVNDKSLYQLLLDFFLFVKSCFSKIIHIISIYKVY